MLYDDLVQPSSYICHHGVKGQKWGVRRYQNKDGSLTVAGRKHYGYSDKEQKKINDYLIKNRKKIATTGKINTKYMKKIDPDKIRDALGRKSIYEFEQDEHGWNKVEDAVRKQLNNTDSLNKAVYRLMPWIADDEDFSGTKWTYEAKMEALLDTLVESGNIGLDLKNMGINLDVDENGQDEYLNFVEHDYNNIVTSIARDLVGDYGSTQYADIRGAESIHLAEDYVRRALNRLR